MYLQMIIYCYHSEDCDFTKILHKRVAETISIPIHWIHHCVSMFIRFSFNVSSLLFDRSIKAREIKCRTKGEESLKSIFEEKGGTFFPEWSGQVECLCEKSMNGRKYQRIIISLKSIDNNYRRIVFTQWNLEILNQTTIKSSTCVATCPILKSNRFRLEKISKVCYDCQE